jgi:basic amino acid/polyamine antiporter, APA family
VTDTPTAAPAASARPALARKLGLFDATMTVMGGIIGSGIFMNAYVVARQVHTPVLIMLAWLVGGVVAMLGAFIYAELAARMPEVGGQYAYLREAYHPAIAFLYGWALLLVTQTGGMAAVAVTFARFARDATGISAPDWAIASSMLALLTVINCLGVKMGSSVQNGLMLMRIAAIAMVVVVGWALVRHSQFTFTPAIGRPPSFGLLSAFGAALTPVLFAFGGWQTANFIAGEMKNPRRNLPLGLMMGVAGVIICYLTVNYVYLRVLGAGSLTDATTPATAVMRAVLGDSGARLIAIGVAVSTLGFLSQSILTAPRVYFAMAKDGLFFRGVAWVHPRTHVPMLAVVLQSVWTMVIAFSGRYEQILNYVVSMDFVFFGLSATCLFVFRARDARSAVRFTGYRAPGHPFTTAIFVAISWLVVGNTIYRYPHNSLIGFGILAAGVPVYLAWRRKAQRT